MESTGFSCLLLHNAMAATWAFATARKASEREPRARACIRRETGPKQASSREAGELGCRSLKNALIFYPQAGHGGVAGVAPRSPGAGPDGVVELRGGEVRHHRRRAAVHRDVAAQAAHVLAHGEEVVAWAAKGEGRLQDITKKPSPIYHIYAYMNFFV